MKCLLLDAAEYKAYKPQRNEHENMQDCLVVLITFEIGDGQKQLRRLIKDIQKVAVEFTTKNIMLGPFAHLSADLLDYAGAQKLLSTCVQQLEEDYCLLVSEFAVEKGLFLDIKPGKRNVKFRSF